MVAFWLGRLWPEIISGGCAVLVRARASDKRDVYRS